MKRVRLLIVLVNITVASTGQDTNMVNMKDMEISFGTFNTINENKNVNVNPSISGFLGDYYFENRYNYEAGNSASINTGKRVLKKIKHFEIVPMAGFVFGSFRGITAELQTSLEYNKLTFSTDNQFSYEYTKPDKSLYLNWSVVRYKITNWFRIGLTTVMDKHINHDLIFDKGPTAVILLKESSLRFYAFNFKPGKSYYWLSLRYTIGMKLKRQ